MKQKIKLIGLVLIITLKTVHSQKIQRVYDTDLTCFLKTDSSKYIIDSQVGLQKLTNCKSTDIDFNRYTLIGIQGSVKGCKYPEIEFTVIKDYEKKQYRIEATVYGAGNCRVFNVFRKSILTDKLDLNFDVVFEVNEANEELNVQLQQNW